MEAVALNAKRFALITSFEERHAERDLRSASLEGVRPKTEKRSKTRRLKTEDGGQKSDTGTQFSVSRMP